MEKETERDTISRQSKRDTSQGKKEVKWIVGWYGSEISSVDLTEEEPACSSGTGKTEAKQKSPEEGDDKLSLICWNIDGQDLECLLERIKGFCSYLAEYAPDVVFLQELTPPYVMYLKKKTVNYQLILGNKRTGPADPSVLHPGVECNGCEGDIVGTRYNCTVCPDYDLCSSCQSTGLHEEHRMRSFPLPEAGYFTGIMLKKSRVKLLEKNVVPYPNTKMMRNLLVAQVQFRGLDLCLMTSHLESGKPSTAERMNQLRLVLQRMTEAPDNVTVLFGGDTNLRDKEMAMVGLPPGVCDIWEKLGSREHCRYTWDTRANDNKDAKFTAMLRFDRIYLRSAAGDGVPRPAPFNMALIGRERLDCDRFTSDHWGIYAQFTTS